MDPERLTRYRPWLYHLTSRENLEVVLAEGRILSASVLIRQAGRSDLTTARRASHVRLTVDGRERCIRDQAPLHEGNIAFEADSGIEDIVQMLNRFVYFWPGKDGGPIDYGVRHFERYAEEKPRILRVRSADVLASSSDWVRLCRYNSGAPRCSHGRKRPRGPNTFLPLPDFSHGVGRVVEVVVERGFDLPDLVEVASKPDGPFSRA